METSQITGEEFRVCKTCGESKPIIKFSTARGKQGQAYRTRACRKCIIDEQERRHGKWTKVNCSRNAARIKKYKQTPKGWAVNAIPATRKRAKEMGVPFSLTTDDIAEAFPLDGYCPALGLLFTYGEQSQTSPSIDRLIPHVGYVPSNIVIISRRANCIKQDASPDQIDAVARWLRKELHP